MIRILVVTGTFANCERHMCGKCFCLRTRWHMELLLMSVSLGALLALIVPFIPETRQVVRVLDRETMERLNHIQQRDYWDR